MVSGDGEQEMITEFFPQIQDSTENERRAAGIRLVAGRGTDFPVRGWGVTNPSAEMGSRKILWVGRFSGEPALRLRFG